jgi:hypothetical protein
MTFNNFIRFVSNNWSFGLSFTSLTKVNSLEIIELCLIVVGEFPEDADILQSDVVPLVVVWVIGHFIIVNIFAFAPHTSNFSEFPRVNFVGSAFLVSILGWNPPTVYNDSSPFDLDGVFLSECSLERNFTSFITVKGVEHVEARNLFAIHDLGSGNEHFF